MRSDSKIAENECYRKVSNSDSENSQISGQKQHTGRDSFRKTVMTVFCSRNNSKFTNNATLESQAQVVGVACFRIWGRAKAFAGRRSCLIDRRESLASFALANRREALSQNFWVRSRWLPLEAAQLGTSNLELLIQKSNMRLVASTCSVVLTEPERFRLCRLRVRWSGWPAERNGICTLLRRPVHSWSETRCRPR